MAKPKTQPRPPRKSRLSLTVFRAPLGLFCACWVSFGIEGLVHRPHPLLKYARDLFRAGVFTQHGYRGHRA